LFIYISYIAVGGEKGRETKNLKGNCHEPFEGITLAFA
jgi:hypothetical protein